MNDLARSLGRQQPLLARRWFSKDFECNAVRLGVEEKYTFAATAKAVGINVRSRRDWHQNDAPQPESCGKNANRSNDPRHRFTADFEPAKTAA